MMSPRGKDGRTRRGDVSLIVRLLLISKRRARTAPQRVANQRAQPARRPTPLPRLKRRASENAHTRALSHRAVSLTLCAETGQPFLIVAILWRQATKGRTRKLRAALSHSLPLCVFVCVCVIRVLVLLLGNQFMAAISLSAAFAARRRLR